MIRTSVQRGVFAALVLLVVEVIPAPTNAQDIDPEVRAAVMKAVDAFNAGDPAAVAAAYGENALRLPPERRPISGRAKIRENAERHFAAYTIQLGFPAMGANVDGDQAVVWVYPYTLVETSKSTGAETSVTGSWVVVLNRVGGEWQIISDIWITDQPQPGPVAAAPVPEPAAEQPAAPPGMPRQAMAIEIRNNVVPQTSVILKLQSANRPLRTLGTVRSNETQTFIVRQEDIAAGMVLIAERTAAQQLVSDPIRDPTVAKVTWNLGINLLTFERI